MLACSLLCMLKPTVIYVTDNARCGVHYPNATFVQNPNVAFLFYNMWFYVNEDIGDFGLSVNN